MRILFVNRKYDKIVGGVERISIAIMNEMIARGHDVDLLSWDLKGAQAFYEMNPDIKWHKLDLGNSDQKAGFLTKIKRALKARQIIKTMQPDAIIAFQDGPFRSIRAYVAALAIPVIAAERNSPSRFDFIKAGRKKSIIFNAFRFAKKITIQCESYKNGYPEYLRDKIVTIPNPVPAVNNFAKPAKGKAYTLLSVGRISFQKNYPILVKAFSKLSKDFPEWQLKLVGGGEDTKKIQTIIDEHDLKDSVILAGESDNVEQHYISSHLFCLPSRWEGFPNALAESMSHGLPAVGFDQCAGVSDLIKNDRTGLLAEGNGDADTLADALRTLMNDHAMREEMGKNAIISMQAYIPEKIYDEWENLFQSVTKK